MLRNGKTYVLFAPFAGAWHPIIRNPPCAPIALTAFPLFRDAQRYVYSIWPDAIRVPDYRTISGRVSYVPERVASLKGKI